MRKRIELDMDFIERSIKNGLRLDEIAAQIHVSVHTIQNRLYERGLTVKDVAEMKDENAGKVGYNCKPDGIRATHDCKYWCPHNGVCDYLIRTGTRRPCPPNNCTVYEKRGGRNG